MITATVPSPAAWKLTLKREFMNDLELGSRLAHRVFHGSFLFGAVTSRMVQFTRLSPRFRTVMQDLFAGTQPYAGLKRRLFKNLNRSLFEIALNAGLSNLSENVHSPRRQQSYSREGNQLTVRSSSL